MTLSLDDVRNKRFRMARKSGYEVLEVDEFVDEVEESFGQLIEENQNLKKQVEALRSSSSNGGVPAAPVEAPPAPLAPPQPAEPTQAAPTMAEPTAAEKSSEMPAPDAGGVSTREVIVVKTAHEASSAVVRLVEMSTEQAEQLLREASEESERIRAEASTSAEELTRDASARAQQLESEARASAERVQSQATSRAEHLDREIEARRQEMLGALESQREELTSTVEDLRSFEAAYRANMTRHLRTQIATLESGRAEPTEVPELVQNSQQGDGGSAGHIQQAPGAAHGQVSEPDVVDTETGVVAGEGSATGDGEQSDSDNQRTSETPRLDALLGDQR